MCFFSRSFVSSVISSNTSTFSSSNYHQYASPAGGHQQQLVANLASSGRVITNSAKATASHSTPQPVVGKHRLPMQLSRPPTTGSIGVSVITPAVGVNQSPQKEVHFKPQHQHSHHQQQLQHFQQLQNQQHHMVSINEKRYSVWITQCCRSIE